jgi:DNA-binding response OmpR family regulator
MIHPPAGDTFARGTIMKEGRVLVVDDEPMLRETLGNMLSDEGYVVDLAIDGESALDRVHAVKPDVILLDLMMPGMNGRQFLQALRDEPAYRNIPVLIMTAVHGLEVNLANVGANELVEKPFDVEDLLNKVALAVYRSRGSDNPAGVSSGGIAIPPTPVGAMKYADLTPDPDRAVVLVIEHDRARLQALDVLLSSRGYTVVTTRALGQLTRLARALRPRTILLDLTFAGASDVLEELRTSDLQTIPVLGFSRGGLPEGTGFANAQDPDLLAFVDRQR